MKRRNLIVGVLVVLGAACAWVEASWYWSDATGGDDAQSTSDQQLLMPLSRLTPGAFVLAQDPPASTHNTPATAVYLEEHEFGKNGVLGLLGRELVRQVVLNAARDGCGADTRDAALGEQPLPGACRSLTLAVHGDGELSMELASAAAASTPLLAGALAYPTSGHAIGERINDYLALISALDAFGRGPLTEALHADHIGAPQTAASMVTILPPAIVADLQVMSAFKQMSALRALHALAREHGQQELISAALTRAYANAAILTEHLWSDTSVAFTARSLLYAERTVYLAHGSPWALRQRAYARILAGFIDQGSADLDQADHAAAGAEPEPTPWLAILRHYAAFDHLALAQDCGNERTAQFALLLDLLCVHQSRDGDLEYSTGYRTLQTAQTCLRAIDLLCVCGGVSNLHRMTDYAPTAMQEVLVKEISQMNDLPGDISVVIGEEPDIALRSPIVTALRHAAAVPCGEPSWEALGQVVADETLLQAFRRVTFMVDVWGVSPEEGIAQYSAAIINHPYRNIVLAYGLDIGTQQARIKAMLANVHFTDYRITWWAAIQRLNSVDRPAACSIWDACLTRSDPVLRDLIMEIGLDAKPGRDRGHRIQAVARQSPLAAALCIDDVRTAIDAPALAAFRRDFGPHPAVRMALAHRLIAAKQWKSAEVDLEAAIAISPNEDDYQTLAHACLSQGDDARYVATLRRYLATEEVSGLDHARVDEELAWYYMKRVDYPRAKPFALAAASTGAGWGMECAQACAEGLGDLDAEDWCRQNAERYSSAILRWYQFHLRTGRGNPAQAEEMARHRVSDLERHSDAASLLDAALIYEEMGEHDQCRSLLAKSFAAVANPYAGLMLALMSWEAGDVPVARTALTRILRDGRGFRYDGQLSSEQVELAEVFAAALKETPVRQLDAMRMQHMLDHCDTSAFHDVNLAYLIARALDAEHRTSEALPFYRYAVRTLAIQKHSHVMACMRLRQLGEDPWPIHQQIFLAAPAGAAGVFRPDFL